jgi:aminoglycoside phosphotransferase (APT) family kinase protein
MCPDPDIVAAIDRTFAKRDVALEPMTGGNSGARLFAFAVDGRRYVARKTATTDLADPGKFKRELACIAIASDLGVAPALIHGDAATGVTILARIDGSPVSRDSPRDGDLLGRLARTLRTLHGGPRFPASPSFAMRFAGFAALGLQLPAAVVDTVAATAPLVEAPELSVSSHRDINPTNILATPGRIYLIDWELAGLADPFYDLGQLGVWVCRDAAERALLIERYLGRAPDADERERIRRCRALALAFYASGMLLIARLADKPDLVPIADDLLATMIAEQR